MTVESRGLVLLVDSKIAFRQEAEEAFVAAGFRVVTSANSMEAIDRLGGMETPDLLVTRARMPRGNPSGFGLAWIARYGRPGLRIVLHTDSDNCLTPKEAANAPGTVLSKVIHGRELVEAVETDFSEKASENARDRQQFELWPAAHKFSSQRRTEVP
jgi:DNA-binding NtrC family response regulator